MAEFATCLQRTDGIKYAIIKKSSNIKKGDPVMIMKVSEKEVIENDRRKTKRGN